MQNPTKINTVLFANANVTVKESKIPVYSLQLKGTTHKIPCGGEKIVLPWTIGTLVRLVPAVDLPVPVEAAGVRQLLTAHLTGHARLPIGSHLARPDQ